MIALRLAILAFLLSMAPVAAADRVVYLTFDDGPLSGTATILDVLQTENVPAVMFMVGEHVEASQANRALVAQAKAMPLVTVGNHSYSHGNNRYRDYYSDTEGVVVDMLRANQVLGLTLPMDARMPGRNVFRLPGMSRDDLSMKPAQIEREEVDFEFVAASGFRIYGWDHEWVHHHNGKPVQSVDRLVSEIDHLFAYNRFAKPGKMILLMHDEMFQDRFDGRTKLTALVTALKQRGYVFGQIGSYDD